MRFRLTSFWVFRFRSPRSTTLEIEEEEEEEQKKKNEIPTHLSADVEQKTRSKIQTHAEHFSFGCRFRFGAFFFIHINADAMCHPHPMRCYTSLTVNCSILDSTLAADGYRLAESKCVLEHYRAGNILHRTNRKMNSVVRGWLAKFSNNLENLFIPMWHWIPFLVGVGDRYLSFLIFY